MARRAKTDDVNKQLLAIRQHVEIHHCLECRQLLHKLANSIQVSLFGKKAKKAKPELNVNPHL